MDFTNIINTVFNYALFLIPCFILIGIIRTLWFKGVFGEWQVNLLIHFFLDKNDYHLIKNVTLPTDDGSTQIDHIIVSTFGIFVIETKNMKGWIFGSENQKQWTQQIYKHKSKFQNPIHQNYKHIKTLESCLSVPVEHLFSVIIFIGESQFKTNMPDTVTYARGGIRYIQTKTNHVFNDEERTHIIEQIESGRLERSFKTNQDHNEHVREIIKEKQNVKSCSKCGADMVLRTANKGKNLGNEFLGCSTFPKCKNIMPC